MRIAGKCVILHGELKILRQSYIPRGKRKPAFVCLLVYMALSFFSRAKRMTKNDLDSFLSVGGAEAWLVLVWCLVGIWAFVGRDARFRLCGFLARRSGKIKKTI